MIVELACDHLVCSLDYELHLIFGQKSKLAVDDGGGFFNQSERVNDLDGHAVAADLEIHARALRLGAPIAPLWDLDIAQRIFFDPDFFFAHKLINTSNFYKFQ